MLLLDDGEMVTSIVITQMLRIQQVLAGISKTDDGEMKYFFIVAWMHWRRS